MSIEVMIKEFADIAANPKAQLNKYKAEGKKCIGVLPYYAPEELVEAAGMVPFGMWGSNKKTIARAKEYCATFYCTIAQLALEMLLDGTMDQLDGIIHVFPVFLYLLTFKFPLYMYDPVGVGEKQ